MKRRAAVVLLLACCGGGTKPLARGPASVASAPQSRPPQRGCLAPGTQHYAALILQGSGEGAIDGSVLDDKHAAVGISVVVARGGQEVTSVTTDEHGLYTTPRLQPGAYVLTFWYGDSVAARKEVTVRAGEMTSEDDVVHLAKLPEVPRCV